ncbi:MAG TPA: stimulus-sensing domain-containing protein, partial [Caulobacteraceae bacterium]|nr:stimulus-sensing domain-containing protein [Caulobacteraceae bacterium]
MASAIDTARPDPPIRPRGGGLFGSRLGRFIIALNLLGLTVLITGALVLNELRRGLVEARIDSLTTQGELIANVIDRAATVGEPEPMLEAERASDILQLLFVPRSQRARLFDAEGRLLADSYVVSDRVEWQVLPPARKQGEPDLSLQFGDKDADPRVVEEARKALAWEVTEAMRGEAVKGMRLAENGEQVVSVSVPIQHVKAVLGVLVLEASDVDEIIARERMALAPFIAIAITVMLFSALLLNRLVARPVRDLAAAADR